MTAPLVLTLPFPVSLNGMYVNVPHKGRVASKRYQTWRRAADNELLIQRKRRFPGRVEIHVALGAPNKLERDGDNLMKCILDTLKRAGIIVDDSNRYVRKGTFEWTECKGAVVTITEAA